MKPFQQNRLRKHRRGLSLLEAITAAAIMAAMMTASTVVLRSSYTTWQAHEADLERAESANAVLRHIVRGLRQATGVTSVTPATNNSGSMTLVMIDGSEHVWQRNNATGEVLFGVGAATSLLADNIDSLTFVAYEADGVTPTTNPVDAQLIRCVVGVTMPFGGGTPRTVSCTGWIRSW